MEHDLDKLLLDAENSAKSGDFEQSKKSYLSALEIDANSASAHYGLGTLAMQRNQLETALTSLNLAQSFEPEAVDITFNLAHCYHRLGDHRQTLVQLQRATKYCKADPVFCPRIADFLLRLGEPEAAIQLLSRLQVMLPDDQIILARAQAALSNWREAVNILRRLNEALPNDSKVANDLAIAAGKLRDFDTSISAYEKYLRLVTPTANDYLRFADLLLIAQRAERCDHALELANELGEDGPELFVMQAKVARLRGDYEAANISLDKALERMSNHGQAWSLRADLADDDQLDIYIKALNQELSEIESLEGLNLQHRALLHYALADLLDRSSDFESAAESLVNANKAQNQSLSETGNSYQPSYVIQATDRLIKSFGREVFDNVDAKIDAESASKQPIFIVGMPRSGTTLVERILGQNPNVFNAGEQEAMEFVAADFNQKSANGKLPEPHEINAGQWSELRNLYFEKLPEISKPIFTDKLPHNFRHVGMIHKLFPEARVIQLHRDVQDVCMSIYARAFTAGHSYSTRLEDIAHFHNECERLMAHWSSMHSPRILDLKYEDLVENPPYYARQLVEFCGFEWDDTYLDFHKSINKSFTFSEMQVREPIANKRVGRWRNYANYFLELNEF